MQRSIQIGSILVVCLAVMFAADAYAQHSNPYRAYYGWAKLPEGRIQGVVAGIYQDPDGQHMWLMDRCGGNNCAGVDVDPILKFDLDFSSQIPKNYIKFLYEYILDVS